MDILNKIKVDTQIGKRVEIETDYDLGDNPYGIDEMLELINSLKSKGATHLKFSGISQQDNPDGLSILYVDGSKKVIETDIQFDARRARRERKLLDLEIREKVWL